VAFRVRLLPAVACTAALAGAAAVDGFAETVPTITVRYAASCGFSVLVSGLTVDTTSAPGMTIPPGPYQVVITTPLPDAQFDPPPAGCMTPSFSLTGPGVSWTSNAIGGLVYGDQTNVTLLPSSTYTAVDANHPQVQRVFSTAATGSSASLLVPGSSTSAGPATGETQGGLIGSDVIPFRGSLHATVAPSGAAALTAHGRSVSTLEPGTYDIVVKDSSKRGGFFVQKSRKKPQTVTTIAFEGSKTVRVYLSAGTWTFFSRAGKPTRFVVA
jgi:hypothetical protein